MVADAKSKTKKDVFITQQALSLTDMQTAFYFLFIGLGISSVAFVGEILNFKMKQKPRKRWAHRIKIY